VALTQTDHENGHQARPEPGGGRLRPGPRRGGARAAWRSWRTALLLGAAALAALLGFSRLDGLVPSLENPFARESIDRSQPPLLQAIQDLSEYRAATGDFQVVVDVEEDTRFVPSFLSGERTQFLAGGSVDASVDFRGLGANAIEVSDDGRSVTVRLPHARLSESRIDPERSYVIARQRGLVERAASMFSDSPTSERELYLRAEDQMAAAAAEGGLVERAEANTVTMLKTMLAPLGYSDVNVVFVDEVPPV
jgi:hypothetical protein